MGSTSAASAILVEMTKRTQAEQDNWKRPRGLTLRGGESIVMVVRPSRALSFGKYLYTLGLYGIWRKRHVYVLTDQRLMTGKGVVNRAETSIPMNRIDEVGFVRRGRGLLLSNCADGTRPETFGACRAAVGQRSAADGGRDPSADLTIGHWDRPGSQLTGKGLEG